MTEPSSSTLILTLYYLAERLDVLAARPDDRADLLDVDLCETTLGAYSEISARGRGDSLLHDGEDVQSAALGLGERLLEDLGGDAGDLDVHLEAGDAPGRSRRP